MKELPSSQGALTRAQHICQLHLLSGARREAVGTGARRAWSDDSMVAALRLGKRKMVDVQRYVSSELSHFVGKDKTEEEQQYQLLLHILKTGWLLHAPFDPTRPRTASS